MMKLYGKSNIRGDSVKIRSAFQHESYKHVHKRLYAIESVKAYEEALFARQSIQVSAAKNDFAAFQILLEPDAATSVTIGAEPYFSTRDVRENIRIETCGLPFPVTLRHIGAVTDDDSLQKADILLADATVEVAAHEICCIWAEADIGPEAEPGQYEGEVRLYHHRMFEPEELVQTLPFTIQIYNVTLPKAEGRTFHLDLWQHNSNIARKHEVPLYGDAHFAILERYVKSLAALGQKAITVVVSEIPWSGQRCFYDPQEPDDLFEYSMIQVRRDKSGAYHYDYSVMQRYIDLCFQYGIRDEIEVFGVCNIWKCEDDEYQFAPKGYPEYIRVRYYDEATGTYRYISDAEGIYAYLSALEEYFAQRGYLDIVRIAADEPNDLERYQKSLAAVQKAAPRFQYKTAVNHREFIEEFRTTVSDFVPGLFCMARDYDLLRDMAKKGTHRVSWYVCCSPKVPNTYLCSHLLESRAIGYLTDYFGFAGFLRWSYTVWPDDPRADLRFRYPDWRCGDTGFVYPSRGGDVLLSLRYQALRRGILDYELLHMARQKGGGALVEEIMDRIVRISDFSVFDKLDKMEADEIVSLTAEDYDWAKEKLLAFLQK